MIAAITVDFWNTLVLDRPGADHRYRQARLDAFEHILRGAGFEVAPVRLERGYERSGDELARLWAESRDVPVEHHVSAILEGAQDGLAARMPRPVIEALVQAYAAPALDDPLEPDPGARGALGALRDRGIRLAIVSNAMRTPGVTLRKVLERHGLLALFAHCVFSDEVGVRKPAPQIFHLALDRLGVEPRQAVHVGDDPLLDVQGARNAGMRVVQVRAAPRWFRLRGPDASIGGLQELPDALARLEGGGWRA